MIKQFLSSVLLLAALAAPATAQKVRVFGGAGERATSSQILFGDGIAAGMAVTYGQPAWKDSYDSAEQFAMLKGKLLRLGKDWWTTFTTGADLEIGGKPLAAGSYLLALSCDADGKFALAVLDAAKGMKGGALPWPDRSGKMNWEPDLLIPLEHSKDAANRSDKLTIALLANGEDLQNGKLQLHWGPHQLTAKLAVHAGKK